MMDTVSTSETSANFYKIITLNVEEDSYLREDKSFLGYSAMQSREYTDVSEGGTASIPADECSTYL
jgi:hypothetical protein